MESLDPAKWPLEEKQLPRDFDPNSRGLYKETSLLHRRIANQSSEGPDGATVLENVEAAQRQAIVERRLASAVDVATGEDRASRRASACCAHVCGSVTDGFLCRPSHEPPRRGWP